jgi:probable GTP-binding protein engB
MIQDYLETRADLKGLVLLVDARHDPTVDDINMFNYALCLNIPILVVATKIDKLKKSAIGQLESKIGLSLDLTQSQVTFLPFSSETKINIDKFWKWIENSIK